MEIFPNSMENSLNSFSRSVGRGKAGPPQFQEIAQKEIVALCITLSGAGAAAPAGTASV
jgi:hypothetical protein